ncbi:RHS repeat-associated core domain-containing protein [Pleomorphomonas oryzae]|uniref:RHS repeat-associated core domain-containing protein n=1 Tax=Pleomorphomonas oryzae TaxID=261934 RepID=UPI0009FC8DE9|nr:RHS repeat-associated core domain-containing protein [Pleomorphomonas oryzae]
MNLPACPQAVAANGNLTSDGTRSYSWDADNRLIGIAYPATPGKAATLAYDGLGRRTTISHTPAGGGAAVATTHVWCGDKPCQARDASNQPQRAYYTEGEGLLGNSPSSLYYGVDQLGSVRRVFASPSSAPTYSYDPYGVPLQTTAPLTDFGYAGLINEPDSGLGLANYRAYDPRVGRWISRDPIGERSSAEGNLYGYVEQSITNRVDPIGLWTVQVGGTVNGQFGVVNIQFGGGIAVDSSGNIAGYTFGGGGAGVGGEASASAGVSVSTASTVCDLGGPFANQSIAGGVIASGSVDTFEGLERGGVITGGGASVGIGAGASVKSAITGTNIYPWGRLW